jgi:low affinity Fe/Cu permease
MTASSQPTPHDRFRHFAARSSEIVGSPLAFLLACGLVAAWAAAGPIFHYSDTWELVINTGTTIVTFLIVFLIQNAQNREAKATQLKLDELIRAIVSARNGLMGLEHLSDEELDRLEKQFEALRRDKLAK